MSRAGVQNPGRMKRSPVSSWEWSVMNITTRSNSVLFKSQQQYEKGPKNLRLESLDDFVNSILK